MSAPQLTAYPPASAVWGTVEPTPLEGVHWSSDGARIRSKAQRDLSYVGQVLLTTIPLWISDMLALVGAWSLSVAICRLGFGPVPESVAIAHWNLWAVGITGTCLLHGLYPGVGWDSAREWRAFFHSTSAVFTVCLLYSLLHGGRVAQYAFVWSLTAAALMLFLPVARTFTRQLMGGQKWWGVRTIIVGGGAAAEELVSRLRKFRSLGLKPVAVIDRETYQSFLSNPEKSDGNSFQPATPLERAGDLSVTHRACWAIFAGPTFAPADRAAIIDALTCVFPHICVTSDSADIGRIWTGSLSLGHHKLLQITENLLIPGARTIKRLLDLTLILLVAPLVIPVIGILALLVKVSSPGPAFYSQPRVGRDGRLIRFWKLRSMVVNGDHLLEEYLAQNPHLRPEWERVRKLANDPRVTSIGRIIRRTSLDELPQLWNVFIGEMSLVGPRPFMPNETELYRQSSPEAYGLYVRMTPGITGLWQVSGRSKSSFSERVAFDTEYVRNWSIFLDLHLLVSTIRTVLTCEGAS